MDQDISETAAPPIEPDAKHPHQPSFLPLASFDKLWASKAIGVDDLRDNPRRVAVDILRLFLANKTPITLWGPVGSRKTRSIQALANETDENGVPYQVITIQPSTEDPTVIHGMMFTSLNEENGETVMKRSLPAVVDQIIDYWEKNNGLTILFMDEMTTCLPAQQHALLGLMTHGQYGDRNIQPYISIAMAANPEGTVSTVNELGEQVINRGGHIAWYGDVSLFLEEWSSGFNNPELEPSATAKWYVTELLTTESSKAFRSDNWTPDGLVPYDLMEHTERSVTELGRMIELIDQVFESAKPGIRKHYIVEVTRALLGEEWAARMEGITERESRLYSPESVISKIRDLGITLATKADDENAKKVREMVHVVPGGGLIEHSAALSLIDGILDATTRRKRFSLDGYIAAWAFIALAQDEGFTMGLHDRMLKLVMEVAPLGVGSGALDKNVSVVPAFVSDETKANLRNAINEARAATGQ